MITFLRRIRKSLIASNSARKYLLYAFGEILLVMIGILLALQVNNWNEHRKSLDVEKEYLSNLMDDFDGQMRVCSIVISEETQIGLLADSALYIIQKEHLEEHLDKLYDLMERLVFRRTFTEYNVTFEDLISSGNLRIISDQKLRRKITSYYHDLENYSTVFTLNNVDLDATYKRAVIENRFNFYKNPSGKLENKKLNDPVALQSLVRLIEQKKKISVLHAKRNKDIVVKTKQLKEEVSNALY